ncbi:MAG TPA: fumarylacetoacetate hydrolase family protein [Blastocatellia bacterium]|nr:fumarylacetoacetate hydrolase family protein [Blastocatellia bacterium]
MNQENIQAAAATIWQHWNQSTRLDELPASCRPANRAEAYAVQAELARLSGQTVAGWKIAATSLAGQAHIGVDGPLAGRLFASKVLADGASIALTGNRMRVAEAEFAFRFGQSLPKRDEAYSVVEVLAAVESLHPAIEIPDSRYHDVVRVGAPQLIADDACACWFILGAATSADWRAVDLVEHTVVAYKNGEPAATGKGANVLGDPRLALTWIANEMREFGTGLQAGEFVTTGTCIVPLPIAPGDQLRVDFGAFGVVTAAFS